MSMIPVRIAWHCLTGWTLPPVPKNKPQKMSPGYRVTGTQRVVVNVTARNSGQVIHSVSPDKTRVARRVSAISF